MRSKPSAPYTGLVHVSWSLQFEDKAINTYGQVNSTLRILKTIQCPVKLYQEYQHHTKYLLKSCIYLQA